MRWFIEVSRIGDDAPIEKYTLEAKQWQAALQEARKLRGDTGPLSKFSIELLEHGYRAVDPAQKIRYVVNKAPGSAQLSEPPRAADVAAGSFPKIPQAGKAPVITESAAPPASTDPIATDPLKTDPVATGPQTDPMAALPPESAPPVTEPVPHATKPSKAARASRPVLTVPEDDVPRAKPPARPSAPAKSGLDGAHSTTQPLTSPPEAKKESRVPTAAQLTQRSIEATREPDFQLIRKREEDPTEKVPINYREYAYAVRPGTDKKSAEVLLWLRFREVVSALNDKTGGKFVQLAVFDHVFERKPARPPIATLAWKDWRGEPVVQFPEQKQPSRPPPPSRPHAAPAAASPAPAPSAPPRPSPSTPPPRPTSSPNSADAVRSAVPPTTPSAAPPGRDVVPISVEIQASAPQVAPFPPSPSAPNNSPPVAASAPAPSAPAPSVPSAPAPSAPAASAPAQSAPQSAPPSVPSAANPVVPIAAVAAPPVSITVASAPEEAKPPTPSAGPTVPIRRRAGEDLIGELFESMHDLHFIPDMVSGVDFVLGILNKTLPSEACLIHVFDINTRQFVVIRALGPAATAVILHRTPDRETLFRRAMRSTRSTRTANAQDEESYHDGRWAMLGVEVSSAMLGPVQLAGRYLGAIELVNPVGGEPYSEHESHALDYICEQFAEFLAARPIVVDADVVLGQKH